MMQTIFFLSFTKSLQYNTCAHTDVKILIIPLFEFHFIPIQIFRCLSNTLNSYWYWIPIFFTGISGTQNKSNIPFYAMIFLAMEILRHCKKVSDWNNFVCITYKLKTKYHLESFLTVKFCSVWEVWILGGTTWKRFK